jgi:hypothetical protein
MLVVAFKWQVTSRAVGIFTIVLPVTVAKFIIKSSLFAQKLKDAGQAETNAWLCF